MMIFEIKSVFLSMERGSFEEHYRILVSTSRGCSSLLDDICSRRRNKCVLSITCLNLDSAKPL